ncbi:MAG: zinc ribbon domain-containing protein [Bacteroidetes bacterium]|nr:MAG: zinc ribbon domain-containing protein [Bacteroidota bacterium]
MPTYVYRRSDGTTFEYCQSIFDEPLTECPTTGLPVKRVPQVPAGVFWSGKSPALEDFWQSGDPETIPRRKPKKLHSPFEEEQ